PRSGGGRPGGVAPSPADPTLHLPEAPEAQAATQLLPLAHFGAQPLAQRRLLLDQRMKALPVTAMLFGQLGADRLVLAFETRDFAFQGRQAPLERLPRALAVPFGVALGLALVFLGVGHRPCRLRLGGGRPCPAFGGAPALLAGFRIVADVKLGLARFQ